MGLRPGNEPDHKEWETIRGMIPWAFICFGLVAFLTSAYNLFNKAPMLAVLEPLPFALLGVSIGALIRIKNSQT